MEIVSYNDPWGVAMRKYILRRLLELPVVLLGVTLMTFGLMSFAAADTVDMLYDEAGGAREEVKDAKRKELGLDQPFLQQYGNWLLAIATGDMGESYVSGKPVAETFLEKLPATASLMSVSIVLTIILSVPAALMAATHQGRPVDYLIRTISFLGNSLPNFYVGLMVLYFLSLKLGLFPVIPQSWDFSGLVMPALTLSIAMGAKYTRIIRAAVLEELRKPYVVGARSRGSKERDILTKEILPNTFIMLITMLALSVGSLLSGTMIVETIFSWDGVGKMAVDAITMRDYPLVGAYVVWVTIIYTLVNLAADVLYCYFDPRVNYEEEN